MYHIIIFLFIFSTEISIIILKYSGILRDKTMDNKLMCIALCITIINVKVWILLDLTNQSGFNESVLSF